MIVPDSIKKLPDRYVPFQATTTRGNYTSNFAMWKVREVVFAVIALFTIVVASGALDNAFAPLNLNALPTEAWKCILAVSVYLGFRTLVFRPLIAYSAYHAIYPMKGWANPGYCSLWPGTGDIAAGEWEHREYEKWRVKINEKSSELDDPHSLHPFDAIKNGYPHDVATIKTIEGTPVHTRLLLPKNRDYNTIVVFSCGRGNLYSSDCDLARLQHHFLDQKVAVMLYHPPGYGQTPGPRTPQKDFLALEAIIQYLLVAKKVPEERIELLGFSIGSGSTLEMASKYALGRVAVTGAFAKMSTSAVHFTRNYWREKDCALFGKIMGFVTRFFLDGVIDDYYGYDNCSAIKNTRVKNVVISQGDKDEFASDLSQKDTLIKSMESEGEALRRAWIERGQEAIVEPVSGQLTLYKMGENILLFRHHSGGHFFEYSLDLWPK